MHVGILSMTVKAIEINRKRKNCIALILVVFPYASINEIMVWRHIHTLFDLICLAW